MIIVKFVTFSINAMHPKTRKILQLLRLRQVRAHSKLTSIVSEKSFEGVCCITIKIFVGILDLKYLCICIEKLIWNQ
jgi:hypothetical protein